MSLYDQASIVMIPSGYKASKLYCAKPTDGSGDLSFTRTGSTATRVNESGLIERCRTNLILQSNTFDNASWVSLNTTETIGSSDFDGGNNAWILSKSAANGKLNQPVSGLPGFYNFSIYAKAGTLNQFAIETANTFQIFDLTNGTRISGNGTFQILSIGLGWYRISIQDTASSTGFTIYPAPLANASGNILIYKAQLEAGDIATDYIPTTSAAVTVGPIANLPRLDYTGGGCPKLLMEPTRTNTIIYSQQINNSAWAAAGGTVTANSTISPSGYQDADTLTGGRYQSGGASNTYTLSCFAKKVDGNGRFILRADTPGVNNAVYDLNNGTIVSTPSGFTSSIIPYGNGWYRCILTTPVATTISNFVIVSADGGSSSTYVYGAQLEAGSYATSYIPTFNASVTRNADFCVNTSATSLIGQTEGTIFADVNFDDISAESIFLLGDLAAGNTIYLLRGTNGNINASIYKSSVLQASITKSGNNTGQQKIAFGYKSDSTALFINGVQVGSTDTSSDIPSMAILRFNENASTGNNLKLNQSLIFKTRLSNSDLATLTTL